ncbi:aspartyl-phosphate phosphatase Spo0E family protein [Siminovitchia sediminis]|uniref:Aspartyl-phosphate phosphatase Spo0E family protein n=1 Tax=Siminovitchia sediminis TaxID=1274353 RepID=A0ABW4KGJ0_9BACI
MKEVLIEEIERKREELFEVTKHVGLTSQIALKYSQELDILLNEYGNILSNDVEPTIN